MAITLPKGFRPMSFTVFTAHFALGWPVPQHDRLEDLPVSELRRLDKDLSDRIAGLEDLKERAVKPRIAIELAMLASPESTEEEIGPGVEVIQRLERDGLIQFADGRGEPSLFRAAEADFAGRVTDLQVADRLVSYFDRTGDFNARTGEVKGRELSALATFDEWLLGHTRVLRMIGEEAGVSHKVVDATLRRWFDSGDMRFFVADEPGGMESLTVMQRRIKAEPSPVASRTDRAIAEAITRMTNRAAGQAPQSTHGPSYMRAVEEQFASLSHLQEVARAQAYQFTAHVLSASAPSAADMWDDDIRWLRSADTYSWFEDPLKAAMVAAETVPDTGTARRQLTEGIAGWWYFMEPLPIKTTSATDSVHALLWAWTVERGTGGLRVSAYVRDPGLGPNLIPSTLFFWPEGQPLSRLMEGLRRDYKKAYPDDRGPRGEPIMGEQATIEVVEMMARFWLAGAIWLQQRILVYSQGHVERHARKRLERQAGRILPDVQVIELRRRERLEAEKREGGPHAQVDWKHRWIVRGHWRDQFYPSLGRHEPKFIEAYPKGPEHLPLKVPTHTIYKVSH
jgi:hypothetical protein